MQEGFSRLWRGTNASLALAVPTVSAEVGKMCVVFCPGHIVSFFVCCAGRNLLTLL